MERRSALITVSSILAIAAVASFLAAGPLNPPVGPVTSTYKTLTEVEPRTNVQSLPGNASFQYTISQSGSYYLSADIVGVSGKGAIIISAPGPVTLDLNGFNITGVTGAFNGITVASLQRTTIRNGKISSWPLHGVGAASAGISDFEGLGIESCGQNGLDLGDGARVRNCAARLNTGKGIRVGGGCVVTDCNVAQNGTGIEVNTATRLTGCSIIVSTSEGILVNGNDAVVENNVIDINTPGGTGIRTPGLRNTIRKNVVTGNNLAGQIGLIATGTSNVFEDNIVRQTPDNYNFVSGNQLSLVISQIPESLDWPCSVRLSGSLTGVSGLAGLLVNSDGVNIDLGGHELVGSSGSNTGITTVGGNRRNISVRNGGVRGWGAGGINLSGCVAPQVVGVRSTLNTGTGITLAGGQVLDSVAQGNTGVGISGGDNALLSRCDAQGNGGDNISVGSHSTVQDCLASGSTGGHGINASSIFASVLRCTAGGNALSGINAVQRTRVADCTCYGNTQHGVHITFGGTVEHCNIGNNVGSGVLVDAGGGVTIRDNTIMEHSTASTAGVKVINAGVCLIEGNHLSFNWRNLDIGATGTAIYRNSLASAGAGGNFVIGAGNNFGPMVNVASVGDITGTAGANHPQANLLH